MTMKISMADFNTILLHVEKISNGQLDFIGVLRGELKNLLNIDNAEPLIDSIKTADTNLINQARLFLANFDFTIEDTDANYRLVKFGDTYCELEPITTTDSETSSAVIPTDGAATVPAENSNMKTPAKTLEQLAVEINFNATQGDLHIKQGCLFYIESGKGLIEAKKQVPYGEFQNWVKANCTFSQDTASNYMKLAERFGMPNSQESESIRILKKNLKPTQLLAMLALPAGEEEKFIEEKAAEGTPVENMTVKQLRADIKKWKKKADDTAAELENLKNQPPTVVERTETIIPPDYIDTKKAAADLQADVDALKKYNSDLRRQYNKANQRANSENSRAQQLAVDKHVLQSQIDDLQQQLHNKKPVEVVPADYEDNKKKLADLQAQIAVLQNQLDTPTIEVVPPADYDETKKDFEDAKLKIAELKAVQDNLESISRAISNLNQIRLSASNFVHSSFISEALKVVYRYDFSLNVDIENLEAVLKVLKTLSKTQNISEASNTISETAVSVSEDNDFDDAIDYLFNGDAED